MSLENSIHKWLNEQGFPFEMRVARQLVLDDFDVTQSPYYLDFEENKPRESDLLARLYSFHEPAKLAAIAELETFCAVECKDNGKPWLIFKQVASKRWRTEDVLTTDDGARLLEVARRQIGVTGLLHASASAGYSAVLAHSESDRAFAALMSAMKAAEAKIRELISASLQTSPRSDGIITAYGAVVIPVVLTTAPVFQVLMLPDNSIELTRVDSGAVALQYPRGRAGAKAAAVVHIVSEAGLSKFLSSVHALHRELAKALPLIIPQPAPGE